MTEIKMTTNKPYLLRAVHEWICDNYCTPYIYVNPDFEGIRVPAHLLEDGGPVILNASLNACRDFMIDNQAVSFQARFNGEVFDVYLPIQSIIAIVARENGQGMTFEWDDNECIDSSDDEQSPAETTKKKPAKKSGLKVVR